MAVRYILLAINLQAIVISSGILEAGASGGGLGTRDYEWREQSIRWRVRKCRPRLSDAGWADGEMRADAYAPDPQGILEYVEKGN